MVPSTIVLVSGFIPRDPEQNTKSPKIVACERGGYGPGALVVDTILKFDSDIFELRLQQRRNLLMTSRRNGMRTNVTKLFVQSTVMVREAQHIAF